MLRFLILVILLAFPIAEIFLLIKLGNRYGWWLLVYLVVIGYLGLQLIRGEKLLISTKMMQSISAGGNPIKTMLGSARNMIAGVLLMIPGVITDAIAVILLLLPIQQTTHQAGTKQHTRAANDDVIEGEFTEITEDIDKKLHDKLK